MTDFDRKKHWENIYETKALNEVSWYQPSPTTSLEFIKENTNTLEDKIIDVGGGDSFLVDHLLNLDYTNITVVDISAKAIERAKTRLKDKALKVTWIVADVADFSPTEEYDIWHDRAAFHFLTNEDDIENYKQTAAKAIKPNGSLIIGTFSIDGPFKCSGIDIKQYSKESLTTCFSNNFNHIKAVNYSHPTPFNTTQYFIFCSFKKA